MTREKELSQAIEKASVPVSDYRVYQALLARADWKTALIPVRFQPRSLEELADLSKLSVATVKRTLGHLQRHGWIQRHRYLTDKGIGGRGHPTRYRLDLGADCDCVPDRPAPLNGAERTRRWRERKKAAQGSVTLPDKGAQVDVTTGEKLAQFDVTKGLSDSHTTAGQPAFCAEEGRDEGEGEREGKNWPDPDRAWLASRALPASWSAWPPGTIGEAMNRGTGTSCSRAA